MDATDPATGERLGSYEEHTEREVDDALARADDAFENWRERPMRERERLLESAAETLRDDRREYAETMTREMGKPVDQAVAEVEKCARCCDHYAEHASVYLGADHHPSPPGTTAKTAHEPLGPVLAVMPWNFRSGRCSASPRPRLRPATSDCSNTPRTCRPVRSPSKRCSVTRATPKARSSRC